MQFSQIITYSGFVTNPIPNAPIQTVSLIDICFQYNVAVSLVKLSNQCYKNENICEINIILK